MYKKILLPTDGSTYANSEVDRATKLLADDGEVIVLSVAGKITSSAFQSRTRVRNINKRLLKEAENKEKARQRYEVYMIKGIMASNSLSEATARAVQRIPDAHCNGDMEAALEEEEKVKKEIQLFLAKQGVNNLIT